MDQICIYDFRLIKIINRYIKPNSVPNGKEPVQISESIKEYQNNHLVRKDDKNKAVQEINKPGADNRPPITKLERDWLIMPTITSGDVSSDWAI
ncbi:hypothetical protein [Microbulbifer sp. TRSA007]|uniref:hypothetical protein n=1 Tax=Microbulbifer sp. TRSA007 TaxID=3243384 RepID=UPI00403A1700